MLFLCPFGGEILRKLKNYKPTKFKAKDSYYDKEYADFAVAFIESLCHTKGTWAGKPFELMDWQEQIIIHLWLTKKPIRKRKESGSVILKITAMIMK